MGKLGVALIALLVAAGTAGCSGDADGTTPDPTPSASTTPASPTPTSASPTPTGPTLPPLPDNAKGETAKAAGHFVEYYIELLNYASATGDVGPLKEASSGKCKGCNSYIKLYRKTYANGGYFKDSGWQAQSPTTYLKDGTATVLLAVKAPRTEFVLQREDPPKIGKAGRYKLRFSVVRRDPGWLIEELAEQESTG